MLSVELCLLIGIDHTVDGKFEIIEKYFRTLHEDRCARCSAKPNGQPIDKNRRHFGIEWDFPHRAPIIQGDLITLKIMDTGKRIGRGDKLTLDHILWGLFILSKCGWRGHG